MAKFGIDSNMVFDANGKSVAARLSDHDVSLDGLSSSLAERTKNFKDFYSTSDGTNYSPTLQRALDYCKNQYALGSIITLFVPKGDYQLLTTVSIDGYIDSTQPTITFHLEMEGYFTALNGIGKMVSIKNCTGCELDIKIKGLNHSTGNLVYSTDWSANVTGLDVALYLESCSYTKLNFYGKRFFGRGIECNSCSTNSWGVIRGDMVGQMMYIRGTSGFGNIGNVWVTEYMGSYFKVTDLTVPYYENMILNTSVKKGIVFDSCVSLWVDVMNVGNNSDAYEVNILSCNNVNISSLYIYGKNTSPTDYASGLYIFQSYSLDITVNTGYIKGDALHIEGIKGSYIKLIDSYSDNIGMVTTTSVYGVSNTTIDIYSRYRNGTGFIVQKGASGQTIDSLSLSINAKDRAGGNSDAIDLKVIDSDSKVTILPSTFANTISLPVTNVVKDVYSTTTTFTNTPNQKMYAPFKLSSTPSTSLTGYSVKSNWGNMVNRQDNNVVGSIALENATNNGNIAVNDIIAQYDKALAPPFATFVSVMCRLSDGTVKIIDATLEWNTVGTQVKAQSAISTSNITRITLNFAYYIA
jgi:hypothetical protein